METKYVSFRVSTDTWNSWEEQRRRDPNGASLQEWATHAINEWCATQTSDIPRMPTAQQSELLQRFARIMARPRNATERMVVQLVATFPD